MCPGNEAVESKGRIPVRVIHPQHKHLVPFHIMVPSLTGVTAEERSKTLFYFAFYTQGCHFVLLNKKVRGIFSRVVCQAPQPETKRNTHILKGTSTPPDSRNPCNSCQVLWRGGLAPDTRLSTLRLTPTSSLCTVVLKVDSTLESPASLQIWCLDASHRENYLLGCGPFPTQLAFLKFPMWF